MSDVESELRIRLEIFFNEHRDNLWENYYNTEGLFKCIVDNGTYHEYSYEVILSKIVKHYVELSKKNFKENKVLQEENTQLKDKIKNKDGFLKEARDTLKCCERNYGDVHCQGCIPIFDIIHNIDLSLGVKNEN